MMNEMTEVLLDSGTATAASGALQRLSAAMAPGSAVPEGDRTIEAFLADLVRPELKAWLDEHLPGLVERIVEREIKKLVRDAQPE
jgi:cell pole-organizing protein PopZ